MLDYTIKRVLLLFATLFVGSVVLFLALRILPPLDAVERSFDQEILVEDPELVERTRERLGLAGPLHEQYFRWAKGFVTGDWGRSINTQVPVYDELKKRIPVSLELSLFSLFFVWAVSLPIGIFAAVKQDSVPDYVLRTVAYAFDALPSFVVGILLLTFLAVQFHWAPPVSFVYLWDDPVEHMRIMALPLAVVTLTTSGVLIRFVRAFMLEVMRQDYIRTARSKGLAEQTVLTRHALRNVSIPLITILGVQVPGLLTSSAIIENLFSLPGMGRYLVTAASQFDYPVVMTTTMFFGIIVLTTHLITDLSYAWLDPRVSYARGS